MMLEESIYTALTASSYVTVTGGASTRIYPMTLPQNPSYNAITYTRVSGGPDYTLSGASGKEQASIQVDCWSMTYSGSKNLANMVRKVMEESTTYDATMVGESDIFEPEGRIYRVSQDYSCWGYTT